MIFSITTAYSRLRPLELYLVQIPGGAATGGSDLLQLALQQAVVLLRKLGQVGQALVRREPASLPL